MVKATKYPHDFPGHFTAQQYLPDHLVSQHFYKPSNSGYEAEVARRVEEWRKSQAAALSKNKKGK